jgi:hypothetical protein
MFARNNSPFGHTMAKPIDTGQQSGDINVLSIPHAKLHLILTVSGPAVLVVSAHFIGFSGDNTLAGF